jgi:hypothetical protein
MEPFSEVHCPICGTKMRVRKQFNNFALQKVIGEGGMGTVFEALDVNLMRPVAVKILKKEYSADEASITQLETEARITASISHPHVVKVFSAGRDHGQFYLAMELVGRGTLDQLMSLQGEVAEIQVLDVGIQISDGLRAAAQIGLIHRDVKPGNILFSDAHTAKVVDFGLAILMEDEAKTRGEIWGTPYYVAPEKLNNEPEDFRSDIYSLGGTLFHALSGRPPFEAASASLVALKHLKSQAVSLQAFAPNVSNETAYVINRMLHKDPMERYQSYDELIEHLKYAKAQLLDRNSNGVQPKARVVVESDATRSYTAWLTVGLILMMIAMGTYVWVKRASLFPDKGSAAADTTVAEKAPVADSAAYDEAVRLLSQGETDPAILLFDQFLASGETPEPRQSWARFQKGLAMFLGGQEENARALFAEIEKKGLYSKEADSIRLAGFLVDTARSLSLPTSISSAVTKGYDNESHEAMALLSYGIKNWVKGDFANAAPLLEKFHQGKLDDAYNWMEIYKPLVANYVADYKLYLPVAQKVAAATTPEQKAAALKAVQEANSKLSTSGAMPEQFQKWTETLTKDVGAAQKQAEDEAAVVAEKALTAETAKWQELSGKTIAAMRDFTPESVLTTFRQTTFSDPTILKKKTIVDNRLGLLAELKTKLIQGMGTAKFEAPVTSRNGAPLPGQPARADAASLYLSTNYGETAIPWKDVSTRSVMEMANKLVVDPNAAHKQWLIGAYATLCGDEAEGKQLLIEAAQSDESLRDNLAVFFEQSN